MQRSGPVATGTDRLRERFCRTGKAYRARHGPVPLSTMNADRWTKVVKPWIENLQSKRNPMAESRSILISSGPYQGTAKLSGPRGRSDRSVLCHLRLRAGDVSHDGDHAVSPPGGKMYSRPSRVSGSFEHPVSRLRKEYAQVKLLSFNALPLSTLAFTKPVTKLEDMKGKKISTGCRAKIDCTGRAGRLPTLRAVLRQPLEGGFDGTHRAELDDVAKIRRGSQVQTPTNSPIKAYPAVWR